jgi:hypothetical protein
MQNIDIEQLSRVIGGAASPNMGPGAAPNHSRPSVAGGEPRGWGTASLPRGPAQLSSTNVYPQQR